MAKRAESKYKLELLAKLSNQRAQITQQRSRLSSQIEQKAEELKEKINVPKRVKESVRSSLSSNSTKWFLSSAAGALLISKVMFGGRRRSRSRERESSSSSGKVSRGLLTSALIYFGKPIVKRMLFNKAKSLMIQRYLLRNQQ